MNFLTTFERRRIEEPRLTGWVLATSVSYTLMAKWDDFVFDGFQIIRNRDITKQYVSDSNRYCSKLMRAEGNWITKLPRGLRKIDLTSWATILSGIKAEVIIVENERGAGRFLIGPIVASTKTAVTIHHFDGVGAWCDPESIPFSRITTCTFMNRYSTTHAKHLVWGDNDHAP